MTAAEVIQIIESGTQQYFHGLIQEMRSNLGTSHYRRLSNDELARRMTVIYRNLEHWLTARDEAAVRSAGEDLGKRRFEEGIPLGQVVLALILEEKYLRKYCGDQGVPLDEEWSQVVSDYFQKMTYHTGRGYEAALEQSNRLAYRAAPADAGATPAGKPLARKQVPQPENDSEISRGGEIGEVAG